MQRMPNTDTSDIKHSSLWLHVRSLIVSPCGCSCSCQTFSVVDDCAGAKCKDGSSMNALLAAQMSKAMHPLSSIGCLPAAVATC
jgi:hypothetical protein